MKVTCAAILIALSFLAAPSATEAQAPAKTARIGVMSPYTAAETAAWHRALRQGLRDLGWVEGKNISIEYRYAGGRTERLAGLAADLVRLNVDVLVTSIAPDTIAAKNATRTIPIVMASEGDPVGSGFVASLAHPGGNVTGLTQIAPELAGKRLQLLKDIVPKLSRVAVLLDRRDPDAATRNWSEVQAPAREMGIQLRPLDLHSAADFPRASAEATKAHADGLVVMPGPLFVSNLRQIADLAARNHLPSIFHLTDYVEVGGLAAYGLDRSDLFRRAATYVDKILKGAKPGDLPVERASKYELSINLKTAKALGLTIPQSILLQAERIVE